VAGNAEWRTRCAVRRKREQPGTTTRERVVQTGNPNIQKGRKRKGGPLVMGDMDWVSRKPGKS